MLIKRSFSVIDASLCDEATEQTQKVATVTKADISSLKRHKVTKLDPSFLYVRFRAIGCLEIDGPNANFDAFPYGEFEDNRPNYGYKSFEGKRAFIEHLSDNIENSIGSLYGAYLNRFDTSTFGYALWKELNGDQRKSVLALCSDTSTDIGDGSIEVLMGIDKEYLP